MEFETWLEHIKMFTEEKILFNRSMGLKVKHLELGQAVLRLPFREDFVGDPFRPALHGGVTSFLIDIAAGMAVLTRLKPEDRCSTLDLRVDYLRPAQLKDLIARATVSRAGSRVMVTQVVVYHKDDEENLVAEGKAVFSVRRADTSLEFEKVTVTSV